MLEGKETLSRMTDKYLALILLLALWELSGRLGLADPTTLPSLSRTVTALFDLWKKYHLFTHIMVSMVRVLIGMVAAVVLAVPLSCLLGRLFPGAYQRLEALFRIFGLINPYCLFPVFVVIFGMGETAKISALVWVAFWPIFFSGVTGVRSVDEAVIKTAMSLNPGEWKLFCKVILPGAMPAIFNGFRIGVERSFFILIAAEMTGSAAG
ncbi:MAG: ABC transporter permease subunit, partial [Deltaproteobacteria bacterium]|nr:ABC transporter permease subunit [Deltaproteobacteria bacterium]